jgi:hypothetical protein
VSAGPDMEQVERTARRAELLRLTSMRARVRVVNPAYPDGGWTGTIAGLLDEPSIILDCDTGRRHIAPQSFAVTETAEQPGEPVFVAVRKDQLSRVLRIARAVMGPGDQADFDRLAYAAGLDDPEETPHA